jgi:hypothetical protein
MMTDDREETPDGADLIIPSWLHSATREEKERFSKDLGTDLGMDSRRARPFCEKEFDDFVIMMSTVFARQSGLEFNSMEEFATTHRTILRLCKSVFIRRPGPSAIPSKRKDFTKETGAAKRSYWTRYQGLREAIGWTALEYDKEKVDIMVSYNSGLASAFVDVKTLEELADWEEKIIGLPSRFYSRPDPWSQSFQRTIKEIAPSATPLTREAALELVWQFGRSSGTVLSNMIKGYYEIGRKAVGIPVNPSEIAEAAFDLVERGRELLNRSGEDFKDALSVQLEELFNEIKDQISHLTEAQKKLGLIRQVRISFGDRRKSSG